MRQVGSSPVDPTIEAIADLVQRRLAGPRRFSTGSRGFQALGKCRDTRGNWYQVSALAVLIGSKDRDGADPHASVEALALEVCRIAYRAQPKLFKSGKVGFFAAGKVRVGEQERYQVTINVVAIAASRSSEGRSERPPVPAARSMPVCELISDGITYCFEEAEMDSGALFAVQSRAAKVAVILNSSHPAFQVVRQGLASSDHTGEALRLLLEAWARYEDEQPLGPRRHRVEEARQDWGRATRRVIRARRDE